MFPLVATIVFMFLTMIWNKKDWLNFFLKVLFFSMMIWGLFETLQSFGFIVRVH